MDKREALKSMLNNIINDKPEEATLDLHNYLTSKMREIAGIGGNKGIESFTGNSAETSSDSDELKDDEITSSNE